MAALRIAWRQDRATSGWLLEILNVVMQDLKNLWLAIPSASTSHWSSGCSHLDATRIAGRPEFVKAAFVEDQRISNWDAMPLLASYVLRTGSLR